MERIDRNYRFAKAQNPLLTHTVLVERSWGSAVGLPHGRVLIGAARSRSHYHLLAMHGVVRLTPHTSMFQGLSRLRDLGFSPTSILDVGAYEGQFSRGARQIWKDAYIFMIDALLEKEPMLATACRELGNANHFIAMLGEREMEAASFFAR